MRLTLEQVLGTKKYQQCREIRDLLLRRTSASEPMRLEEMPVRVQVVNCTQKIYCIRNNFDIEEELVELLQDCKFANTPFQARRMAEKFTLIGDLDGIMFDARDETELLTLNMLNPKVSLFLFEYSEEDLAKRRALAKVR